MITFIEITILLGLIAFPIIKSYFKGALEFIFIKGFVLGANYDSVFFRANIADEDRTFQLHTFSFYIMFLAINMAFSIERPDVELFEEEE